MAQSVCCQQFANPGNPKSALSIIMLDYYDGPTAGLMKCELCNGVYKFTMVDWNDHQEMRIHALASISPDAYERIEKLKLEHEPKWWPAGPEIDEILATAEEPSIVAAFSRTGDQVFAMRKLTEGDLSYVLEWLSLEDPASARDWFSFLGLPREPNRPVTE